MDDPSLPHDFDPVGQCIYCGCLDTANLHIEHIVPEGLGGRFELPQASCTVCEGVTSYVEGVVLRGLFYAPRARLGMLSKKRKKGHPVEWPIEIDFGTRKEPRKVPIAKHPTIMVSLVLPIPSILVGIRDPDDKNVVLVTRALAPDHHALVDEIGGGRNVTLTMRYDGVSFTRMLAKIGHAYAVAKLGIGGFKPLLREIIREKPERIPLDLVGGYVAIPPPSDQLHEISLEKWDDFHVVRLRLFANFEMPIYYIVVGTS